MKPRFAQSGFSLIEILVTIIIMMIGLLGLAGLQGKAMTAQLESYQRSQALVLLKDIENRMNANRANIASYVTGAGNYLGVGMTCPSTAAGSSVSQVDLAEWCDAITGSAEVESGVAATGVIIGARGCIVEDAAASTGNPARYTIAIAWQGVNPISAVKASSCGQGLYGDERLRRVLTLPIYIGDLN